MSFTCFRLVPIADPAPGEGPFETIELCDPTNAMRMLAIAPRSF